MNKDDTLERYRRLAREDASGTEAVEELYLEALSIAKHATGFVVDGDGLLNRPGNFADKYNAAMAKGPPDNGIVGAATGVIGAVLFPRAGNRMSPDEYELFKRFMDRYIPSHVANESLRKTIFGVMSAARNTVLPLIRNIAPVLDANGRPLFDVPHDPYSARACADLALLYHMEYRFKQSMDEMRGMMHFVHNELSAAPEGEPSLTFSRPVLERFTRTHFHGYLHGRTTPLMSRRQQTEVAYRLYVNGALDRMFADGELSEGTFCATVARCTRKEPNVPSRRMIVETTPMRNDAPDPRDRQSLDNTAIDHRLGDAYEVTDDGPQRRQLGTKQ